MMANEYIKREDVLDAFGLSEETRKYGGDHSGYDTRMLYEIQDTIESIPSADVVEIPKTGIGDLSDGYHTFNDLYYQRCILFAQIVNDHKSKAWKTRCHEDGQPCFGGGWFLVTIDTPNGAYGYHYEDKYWDLFDCEEIPKAKPWDGYTEKDVTRLFSLPAVQPVVPGKWIVLDDKWEFEEVKCSNCGCVEYFNKGWKKFNCCPTCGARMDGE